MKVLVTGARGQAGAALTASTPAGTEVIAVDRAQLDITDRARVLDTVGRAKPAVVINAAAYTAVDRAEEEQDAAFRINCDGAGHLAEAAQAAGARMIQISTDYVFDGTRSTPYRPEDAPNPLGVYGRSKLAGEQVVAERTQGRALIVRTAWVYAATGQNFVRTMLRLLRERPEVRVVGDQIGTPTHAAGLARALWGFVRHPDARGIWHWTDAGVASWYDFAVAIRAVIATRDDTARLAEVVPITTAEYPTAARRPAYGVLDKGATWSLLGPAAHWSEELRRCLAAMPGD